MTIKLRTTDQATTNDANGWTETAYYNSATFTYDELIGTKRYYYPAMWDDETVYDELGGKTLYQVLYESGTGYYWQNETVASLLGATKVELDQPILAWTWNEGVLRWDGKNPATMTWGDSKYNYYTTQRGYQFMYGMKADDDGSIAQDYTTFSNTYGVMGIDIIASDYVPDHVYVEATGDDAVAAAIESASAKGQTLTIWSGGTQDDPDYSWTFDATGLTGEDAFAYTVIYDAETDDDVANIFAQATDAHLISFEHEGTLPATVTVRVKANGYQTGDELKLFSYDADAKVFTKEAEGIVVDEQGAIEFDIDHCSLWAVSKDDLSNYAVKAAGDGQQGGDESGDGQTGNGQQAGEGSQSGEGGGQKQGSGAGGQSGAKGQTVKPASGAAGTADTYDPTSYAAVGACLLAGAGALLGARRANKRR
jgi:hypothetical protein